MSDPLHEANLRLMKETERMTVRPSYHSEQRWLRQDAMGFAVQLFASMGMIGASAEDLISLARKIEHYLACEDVGDKGRQSVGAVEK